VQKVIVFLRRQETNKNVASYKYKLNDADNNAKIIK
jgi:hypothetical protein